MAETNTTFVDGMRTVSPPHGVKRERSNDDEADDRCVLQRTDGEISNVIDLKNAIVEHVKTINLSTHEDAINESMCGLAEILFKGRPIELEQTTFVRVGGPLAVVSAMIRHPDNKVLQGNGMAVLMNATYNNGEIKSVVVDVGGVPVILQSMKRFESSGTIQFEGLGALCCLSSKLSHAKLMVENLGVLSQITEVMKAFGSDPSIVFRGCHILSNLANFNVQQAMIDANVTSTLAAAMEGHKENSNIQNVARQAMQKLLL